MFLKNKMGCLKLSYGEKKYTGLKVVYNALYENGNNCTGAYRFGFNGQEKDDEIAGAGNIMTAEFWEYDSRTGRRWNTDPKMNVWEGSYVTFGDNPITNIDPNGDKWGKPGNEKQAKQDKAQADKLRSSFSAQEQQYKSEYDNLSKQAKNFSGDKTSDTYKNLVAKQQDAFVGMNDMKQAQEELTILENDANYYTFKMVYSPESGGELNPSVTKNTEGTYSYEIPFAWGSQSTGTKAHETKHAFQFSQGDMAPSFSNGSNTTSKFHQDQYKTERGAYIRQFHTSPESLIFKVNSYKDINSNYLKQFKTKDGNQVYDQIK
jgi:hypothetical protein